MATFLPAPFLSETPPAAAPSPAALLLAALSPASAALLLAAPSPAALSPSPAALCPMCGALVRGDNAALNAHIDLCLNADALQAVHDTDNDDALQARGNDCGDGSGGGGGGEGGGGGSGSGDGGGGGGGGCEAAEAASLALAIKLQATEDAAAAGTLCRPAAAAPPCPVCSEELGPGDIKELGDYPGDAGGAGGIVGVVLRGCGHASCEGCLRQWLTEQLRQGRACLTCLMPGCAAPLSPAERLALLPTTELAVYDRLQLTAAAAAGSHLYPCPAANCTNIVHWEPRTPPPPCAEGAGPQSAQSVVWREPDWPCLRCPLPCGVGSCLL